MAFPFQSLLFDGGDDSVPYLFGSLSSQSLSLISYYNILQWIIFQISNNMIIAHNYLNLLFFILLPFSIYTASIELSKNKVSAFLISLSLGTFSNYVTLTFVSGGYEFIGLLLFGFLCIKYLIRNIRLPNKSYRNLSLAGTLFSLSALSTFPLGFYVLFPMAFLMLIYSFYIKRALRRIVLIDLLCFLIPIALLLLPIVLSDLNGLNSVSRSPSSTLNYVLSTIKYGYSGMSIENAILNSQPGVTVFWPIVVSCFILFGFTSIFRRGGKNKGLITIAFIVYFTFSILIILINRGFTFIITDISYLWIFDYAGFFELGQIFALIIIGTMGIDFLIQLRKKTFGFIVVEETGIINHKPLQKKIILKGKYLSFFAIALIILLISSSYYSSYVDYPGRVVPDSSDSFSPSFLGIHSWYESIAKNYSGEIMFLPNTEPCYNIIASTIPVNRAFNAPFPLPNTVFNYSSDVQLYSSIGNLNLTISSSLLGAYGVGYLVIMEGQRETVLVPAGSPYNVPSQIEIPTNILITALNQSIYFSTSFVGRGFIVYSVVPYFSMLNSPHQLAEINNISNKSFVSGIPVDMNAYGSFFGGYPSKNVSIINSTVYVHGYGSYFLIHVPLVHNLFQNLTKVVYNIGFSIKNKSEGRVEVNDYFSNKTDPSAIFTNNGTSIASVYSGYHNFSINIPSSFVSLTVLFVNDNSSINSTIEMSFPNMTYGYSPKSAFDYNIFNILKERDIVQQSTLLLPHLISHQIPDALKGSICNIYVNGQLKPTVHGNRSIVNYDSNATYFVNYTSYGSKVILDLLFQPNSTGNVTITADSGQPVEFNLTRNNSVIGEFNNSNKYIFNFPREDHLIMVLAVFIPNHDINSTVITVNLTNPYEKLIFKLQSNGYFGIGFENIPPNYHLLLTITETDVIILAILLAFTLSNTLRFTFLTIFRRYLFKKKI